MTCMSVYYKLNLIYCVLPLKLLFTLYPFRSPNLTTYLLVYLHILQLSAKQTDFSL